MPSICLSHEVEEDLQVVKELQQREISLAEHLSALAGKCQSQQWLIDGGAEEAAAELCQLVGIQQKLRARNTPLLNNAQDLLQAENCLSGEADRLQAFQREQQLVQRFCQLETADEILAVLLPQRKARLQEVVQAGLDNRERERWLDACKLLLEQLHAPDAPDVSRSQEILTAFQDTLGVEFLTGLYARKLKLPAGGDQAEPPPPPVPLPPQETMPELPVQLEQAQPPVKIEEWKQDQKPSGKHILELMRKTAFNALLLQLDHYVVVWEDMLSRKNPDLLHPLSGLVRDGLLYKITLQREDPCVFYQASPKLCAGLKKQSVQDELRRHNLPFSLKRLKKQELTVELLEQVCLVQGALPLFYSDEKLCHWSAEGEMLFTPAGRCQLVMTFSSNYSDDSVHRRILSLEGLENAAAVRQELDAGPEPVWIAAGRLADILPWQERLAGWGLPQPEWLALDSPAEYILSDGTRRPLLELFPPEPGAGADEPREDAPAAEEAPSDTEGFTPVPEPVSEPISELVSEPVPAPVSEPAGWSGPTETDGLGQRGQAQPKSNLFDLGKPGMDFQDQAAQWAAAEKFPQTLCLLRSASCYDPALTGLQLQMAYALDDPMENCEYLDDRLSDVYAAPCGGPWGTQGVFQLLRTSAYLRMAFSSAVSQQSYQIAGSLQDFSGEGATPSLDQAFHLLSQFVRIQRRGVDRQIIQQVHQQGDVSTGLEELAKTAGRTQARQWHQVDHRMERIKLMFDYLFGSQSATMQMLDLIAKQRIDRRGEVLDFCRNNQLVDADGVPDPAGIARFIDWIWQSVPAKRGKNSNLTGTTRTQAMNRMTACVDICAQWLDLTGGNLLQDTEDAAKQCNQLASYLIKAQDELMARKPSETYTLAAWAVLNQTLTDLGNALQGRPRDREDYFIEFLYTGYIELDGGFRPVLEPPEYMIPGYEPWERLLRHDEAMMMSAPDWDAPAARILGADEEKPDFRNFGSAQLILRHCQKRNLAVPPRLDEARLEDDDRRTLTRVNEIEDRFRAELELAATYGQIEDNTHKEHLATAVTKQQREHYDESRNWGSYFCLMRACLAAVRKNAERLEPRYRYEFDQLKQTTPPCPIFDDIENLLNEKMFSVAHDYMQLVLREHITKAPEGSELQKPRDEDNLLLFLNAYNSLQHRSAERNDKEALYSIFRSLDSGEQGEDAELLLTAWPQDGQADTELLRNLFRALAFPVSRVEQRKDGLFRVEMSASTAHVFNYPHPIAAYGTELFPSPERGKNSGLDVYLLNGRKTADELVLKINGLGLDSRPTIFLLNYSIPLADRREMARKLKQDSAHHPTAIVLDRVLMLFLARYPQAERACVLLQCTLPFHSYNPYTEGNTPPEMFMGRDAQLRDILRNGQANIIYGGRQLGKTALLRRAASLADDRRNSRWAIYTDKIYRLDYNAALAAVYKCLYQNGFLDKDFQPKNWEELCGRIQARMDKSEDRIDRFLLLLDKADHFLESSSALNYRPVECLYQLETATAGRFKFVLAGLHSVTRFFQNGTKDNSVLGKLSSLSIKPLNFQEASQLLEQPLYYLGFRMKPEQDVLLSQILLSTNYYPGLIQFYCQQLVDSLKAKRTGSESTPPYQLDVGTIRSLLQKESFVEQIRDRFFITLDAEEDKLYYRALAYSLAYCYYYSSEDSVEGYTFEQIQEIYEGFKIHSLCSLEPQNVKLLLSEMEDLNVFIQINGRYSFNGNYFRHMMGGEEAIAMELGKLSQLGGEEK